MNNSRVNTVKVPSIFGQPLATATPLCIVSNAKVNCVVRIRNLSLGSYILVAFDAATLQSGGGTKGEVWQIPAGDKDEFVVAKGQNLLCSSPTGGGEGEGVEISYHIFQAFPTDEVPR